MIAHLQQYSTNVSRLHGIAELHQALIARLRRYPACTGLLLFLALLVPPVKQALEASMTAQMLVQIPLLAGVGCLLGGAMPKRTLACVDDWNHLGITGLMLATFTGAYWMLPRALDAAVTEPLATTVKYLSVPLLIGLPLALSWPRMSFIIRGVLLTELIATCFRLGWLYLASPVRLCNNYSLDDQQQLGEYLLAIGSMALIWIAWKLIWGRVGSLS